MPLLIILGLSTLAGTGALAFSEFTTKTNDVMTEQTPNVLAIGALAVAGIAIWAMARKR